MLAFDQYAQRAMTAARLGYSGHEAGKFDPFAGCSCLTRTPVKG